MFSWWTSQGMLMRPGRAEVVRRIMRRISLAKRILRDGRCSCVPGLLADPFPVVSRVPFRCLLS